MTRLLIALLAFVALYTLTQAAPPERVDVSAHPQPGQPTAGSASGSIQVSVTPLEPTPATVTHSPSSFRRRRLP